jgi:hypothetical protein
VYPLCEQPIPHDRFEEINERIEVRERERESALEAKLLEGFALEKAQLLEAAEAKAAEAAAKARVEATEAAQAAAKTRIDEANAAKAAAEASVQVEVDKAREEANTTIEQMKQDAIFREVEIRVQANSAAEAAAQEKIAGVEQARAAAEAKANEAEEQVRTLQRSKEAELAGRLKEQREALEADKVLAVNAEKSTAFQLNLKLSNKIEELQRQVDNKTAEELGEGAELDLFEALKTEFESDRIERVTKGQAGADIVYDSKNHGAWRNDFVSKLAADQMAAKAEHAILASRTFPQGARHLHVRDGVIIASPARVVALIKIIRQHLVQSSTLRLSNEARTEKTAVLYAFITSERCTDLLSRIDTHSDDLLDLQVREKKAHDAVWKKQGELIRSVQRVRAELCNEIDSIIGTA